MAKPNCLIHFISLMLAGAMLLCACNAATVAPYEYAFQLHNGSPAHLIQSLRRLIHST